MRQWKPHFDSQVLIFSSTHLELCESTAQSLSAFSLHKTCPGEKTSRNLYCGSAQWSCRWRSLRTSIIFSLHSILLATLEYSKSIRFMPKHKAMRSSLENMPKFRKRACLVTYAHALLRHLNNKRFSSSKFYRNIRIQTNLPYGSAKFRKRARFVTYAHALLRHLINKRFSNFWPFFKRWPQPLIFWHEANTF